MRRISTVFVVTLLSTLVGCGGLDEGPTSTPGKGDDKATSCGAGCVDAAGVCVEASAQHNGLCGSYGMPCGGCSDDFACTTGFHPVTSAPVGGECVLLGRMTASTCKTSNQVCPLPKAMHVGASCTCADQWGSAY